MKKLNLELKVVNCKKCEKPTEHQYIGKGGTIWHPIFFYSCLLCKDIYGSLKRIK